MIDEKNITAHKRLYERLCELQLDLHGPEDEIEHDILCDEILDPLSKAIYEYENRMGTFMESDHVVDQPAWDAKMKELGADG